MFDCVIVGAGPAGLSAALILGRCLRRVLVCDAGHPRNAASHALHGFLTRDGIKPSEFLRIGREQLMRYTTVEFRDVEVVDAKCIEGGFEVSLGDGTTASARKLLLATGVVDRIPEIEGIGPMYGLSVFHCPYCDGWERRNQPIAAYGRGEQGLGLALELTAWSGDIVLCTDGPAGLDEKDARRLRTHNIKVRDERILRLEGAGGMLERVVFDGGHIERTALFFSTGNFQRSPLPSRLGCDFTEKGAVRTGKYEITEVAGLYVAGDASEAVQLAVIAAAEGASAAFAINTALLKEDLAGKE
jgi:thioredoxin reductase